VRRARTLRVGYAARHIAPMTPRLLILFALVVASPAGAALAPGTYSRDLPFGGVTRNYLLRIPPGWDGATAVPLVVDIHGLGSNATQQRGISGFAAVGDREKFVVAYPNGLNNAWNSGICCGNAGVDDVGFIRAVVAAVSAELAIDPSRVYATGLSNGGAMTQRLACDAADLFAAFAPMAFPVPFRPLSECQPTRAVPILTFMGLTDVLVHYAGGAFPSAPATFAYWRDVDGCGTGAPEERVERGMSRCETHTSCTNGVQAGLCSITADSFGSPVDGHILYLNPDFQLADVAWTFFTQFELPAVRAPVRATLAGRDALARQRAKRSRGTLRWATTFGDGTWAASGSGGGAFTGTAVRRKKSSAKLALGLTGDSEDVLVNQLAARATALAGEPVTLAVTGTRITAHVPRRRGKVRLDAVVDLAATGASGATSMRWTAHLRGTPPRASAAERVSDR
jgi:polyhydroxybutyrate depolymerase